MKIGILAAGYPPPELMHRGSYAQMLHTWFTQETGQSMAITAIDTFKVLEGEFPNSAADCDVWLMTGSRHGVYDPLPWIQPLKLLIQHIHQAQIPLVGICFGHQIIAEALGGKVQKSAKGWGIGLHTYTLLKNVPVEFSPLTLPAEQIKNTITLNAFHQDQIIQCPAEAHPILSSDFCEFAGLVYGQHILTLQAHPEFSIEFEKELIQMRKPLFTTKQYTETLARLNQPNIKTDQKIMAQWAQQLVMQNANR